jgi:hypothetical protein
MNWTLQMQPRHSTLLVAATLALSPGAATAQDMTLGTWVFTQGPAIQTGSVTTCTTNAPAGSLYGGNPRQPVLKAHASVTEPWLDPWSICGIQVDADAPLTVGRAKTEIELECVLYGVRTLEDIPGRVTAVGFASIIDASGTEVAKIGCPARPFIRANIINNERVHATTKAFVCLDPEPKYTVHGELSVQALINRGWGGQKGETEFFTDDNSGLPAGLMLIVQPRGTCQ